MHRRKTVYARYSVLFLKHIFSKHVYIKNIKMFSLFSLSNLLGFMLFQKRTKHMQKFCTYLLMKLNAQVKYFIDLLIK